MEIISKCETCMSSFISLLLAAANMFAISFVLILSINAGSSV